MIPLSSFRNNFRIRYNELNYFGGHPNEDTCASREGSGKKQRPAPVALSVLLLLMLLKFWDDYLQPEFSGAIPLGMVRTWSLITLVGGSQPPPSFTLFQVHTPSHYRRLPVKGSLHPARGPFLLQFPAPAPCGHQCCCSSAAPADSIDHSFSPPRILVWPEVSTALHTSRGSLVFPVRHTLS